MGFKFTITTALKAFGQRSQTCSYYPASSPFGGVPPRLLLSMGIRRGLANDLQAVPPPSEGVEIRWSGAKSLSLRLASPIARIDKGAGACFTPVRRPLDRLDENHDECGRCT